MSSNAGGDLARTTLAVLFIGGLVVASFWILRPFLGAAIWAVMIVVATWPMLVRVQRWAGGRRWLAVTAMMFGQLLVFIVPLMLAIVTIIDHAGTIVAWGKNLGEFRLPPAPDWLLGIPLIGEQLVMTWETFAIKGVREIAALAEPYAGKATRWIFAEAGGFGLVFVQVLLTMILSVVFYANGEEWAGWMVRFGRRLAKRQGEQSVVLAGLAIRGVALGIVVTALAQSALGGIALAIAGVPFFAVLTAIMFLLCIAQLGPTLVMLPAVGWLYWSGDHGWGSFLLVCAIFVGTVDNILRPYLIKQGADLPLLLIFAGVIGGLLAFGLLGIFVGPVVLAVAYTLIDAWVSEDQPS